MSNPNPQMPNDPGAPENTDTEYVSPDKAEALADEAAESEALQDEDPLRPTAEEEAAAGLTGDVDADVAQDLDRDLAQDVAGDAAPAEEAPDSAALLVERTEDLQRVSAEYANYRRRTERERGSIAEQAKTTVLVNLLPLLDDLDLAEQHGDLAEGPLKVFEGKFRSLLSGQGVHAFGEEGEAFDPEIHEAVQDLSSGDDKVVGTVLRKGYRVGERLVRNAMVIIADPAGASETAGE
ncbi:heat shock protein GrpE [Corynebacterium capitovis DSM 44611]|uniref:nucleotide exchange factor GrpE n=1 Tax=Corynebacterium capitovis TaxID=131081 RepID=UPI00036BB406|nr:nucleotide exchange factor GrpE [Corynebacterium capitovis]WKD58238.1 heat shock protein GrpE [Corynebacterium capitovis DSM 44611]